MGDDVVLLDLEPLEPDPGEAGDHGAGATGQVGRRRAPIVAGLIALGLALWALAAITTGASDPSSGIDRTAESRPTPAPEGASPSVAGQRSTTDPPAIGPSSSGSESSTPSSAGPGTPTTARIGDGSPLLGRTVGLSLLVGSERALRRVDLDTGAVYQMRPDGLPVLVDGPWLVLWHQSRSSMGAVRLDDPEAAELPLKLPAEGYPTGAAAGPSPGLIWIRDQGSDGQWARLIDAPMGTIVEERQLADSGEVFWFDDPTFDPTLIDTPSGGVFEWRNSRFERVGDGRLVASDPAWALLQTCNQPDQCEVSWFDRRTWQPVDRAMDLIGPLSPLGSFRLMANGSVVASRTLAGRQQLIDVTRNRVIVELADYGAMSALAESPDGNLVAAPNGGNELVVYDVSAGQQYRVPFDHAAEGLAFVPTDTVAP